MSIHRLQLASELLDRIVVPGYQFSLVEKCSQATTRYKVERLEALVRATYNAKVVCVLEDPLLQRTYNASLVRVFTLLYNQN